MLGKHAKEAVSLGKLDLDPKLVLDIKLLGGDTVAKGNPKFELQKDGEGATPGWSVQMAGKNKEPLKIARVWHEGSEWKIQWTDEAKDKATLRSLLRPAVLLRGAKPHFVALTSPRPLPRCRSTSIGLFPHDDCSGISPCPTPAFAAANPEFRKIDAET